MEEEKTVENVEVGSLLYLCGAWRNFGSPDYVSAGL